MSHILGATSKIGENEGQIHLDVHTLSPLGQKLVKLVSKHWNSTDKVIYISILLVSLFCTYKKIGNFDLFVRLYEIYPSISF